MRLIARHCSNKHSTLSSSAYIRVAMPKVLLSYFILYMYVCVHVCAHECTCTCVCCSMYGGLRMTCGHKFSPFALLLLKIEQWQSASTHEPSHWPLLRAFLPAMHPFLDPPLGLSANDSVPDFHRDSASLQSVLRSLGRCGFCLGKELIATHGRQRASFPPFI